MATRTFDEHYKFSYLTTPGGNHLEPKTKNRFVVYIPDLPAALDRKIRYLDGQNMSIINHLLLSLQTFSRPTYSVEVTEVPNFNSKFYLPGKVSSDKTISCSFIDFFSPNDINSSPTISTASIIYRWFNLVNSQDYDDIGYKDYFSVPIHLYILTPTGVVAEHWKYYDAWPTLVNFGDLSYQESGHLNIEVTFKYERAKMISEAKDSSNVPHNYQSKANNKTADNLSENK